MRKLNGLVAFVSYLLMIIWPIESLGWILGMAEEAATAAERVFEVFDSEPRVQDRDQPLRLGEAAGRVKFEGVDFRYPGYGDWILLSPPLLSPNGLVWLAPLLAIALGAWLAWRRARAPAPVPARITPAERAELEALVAAEEP